MANNEEILTPKVLIIPAATPAPTISGANPSVVGTLYVSGGKLVICSDVAGTWETVGEQTG